MLTNEMRIGYDQAEVDAFHPEMGWFWDTLDEVRMKMYERYPDALYVIGDMNDILVEELMKRFD